eukprot:scaffold183736_cov36-Prasinocladus_malaysianus.AAC.1
MSIDVLHKSYLYLVSDKKCVMTANSAWHKSHIDRANCTLLNVNLSAGDWQPLYLSHLRDGGAQ